MTLDPQVSTPPRIPEYELLRRIGAGSYGDVWIARTATGVYRAVKIVWRNRFEDAGPYDREFHGLREFEKVSLSEARQLALLHVGRRDEEGFFYYVMELADDVERGREIDAVTYTPLTWRELRRDGAMAARRVVELAVELLRGLAVLHDRGLVHRDIKPSNIIMVGGAPKLADVGLVTASTLALTFVGTEGFVPPEGPGRPAGDVYGVGKVLYELLTGLDRGAFPSLPEGFGERTDRTMFLELNAVILRACDPDIGRRQPDATAMLDEVLLVQAGRSVRRMRAAEMGLARALRGAAVLGMVAVIAGAGAGVAWSRAQREMTLRAEAEAERDALARKTQYAGLLAQASAALDKQEFGLARRLAETASHKLVEVAGPELNWINGAAWGDVEAVVRAKGPAILRLAVDDAGRRLAGLESSGGLFLYDLEQRKEVGRLTGIGGLAGWVRADSVWLAARSEGRPVRIDEQGNLVDLELKYPERAEPELGRILPIGMTAGEGMWAVEWERPGRFAEIRANGDVTWVGSLWAKGESADGWQVFRTAVSADGTSAAVAWVWGQGSGVKFALSVMNSTGWAVGPLSTPVRPGALGWITTAAGQDRLEVVDDVTGARAGFDLERETWVTDLERTTPGAQGLVTFAGFSGPRGLRAVGADIWDEATGTWWRGQTGVITQVVAVPGTDDFITGSAAGEVLKWGNVVHEIPRRIARTDAVGTGLRFAISEDGERLYLPGPSGVVCRRATDGLVLGEWPRWRWLWGRVASGYVGVSHDGRVAAVVDEETGEAKFASEARVEEVINVATNESGTALAYTRTDGSLWLAEETDERGDDRRLDDEPTRRWGLVMDRRASRLWYTNQTHQVVNLDLATGGKHWSVLMPALVSHVERIEARDLILVAVTNGDVHVLDGASGATRQVLTSGSASAEIVLASADGRRVVVGGNDGGIHVFDTEHWLHIASFGRLAPVSWWMLGLAGDGSRLAGLTRDGQLQVIEEARQP